MSKARHANCSVVGCKDQHKCLYSVPAPEEQKRQWLCFIFNNRVPATFPVNLFVCANHFTSACFSNEGQYKAGFASTLTLIKGSVPTIRHPATAPGPQGTDVSTRQFLPAVKHVACQTDPPGIKSVGTQLTMKYPFRSKATQARVPSRDCGVGTLTFPLDSPLLFLQPTIVKRPSKRPRLSLTDNEEEEEGPSQCTFSVTVHEPEDST